MKKLLIGALVFFLILSGTLYVFAGGAKETEPEKAVEKGKIIEDPGKNTFATLSEWEACIGKKLTLNEAPSLKKLVAEGKLPPLEDRLPKDPIVYLPLSEVKKVGKYSDIMYAQVHGTLDTLSQAIGNEWGAYKDRYPQTLKKWEVRNNGKEYIFYMREGLKWSDGTPFTTEDVQFWYEDVALNEELNVTIPFVLKQASGNPVKLEVIDKYTYKLVYDETTIFEVNPSGYLAWYQKKYLSQFHPRYQDKATLDKLVKDAGVASWTQLFTDKADFYGIDYRNPERPVLGPWMIVQGKPSKIGIMRRNPYYHGLDAEGNQLPYIEEIRIDITENYPTDVIKLKAINGEIDFVNVPGLDIFPTAKEAEKEGKIKVVSWERGDIIGMVGLEFNQTTNNPLLREIFQKKEFRFGISHAINREMINKLNYFGMNAVGQLSHGSSSPYYYPELTNTAMYDLDKANRLLDEAGIDKKDADGWRLMPNGEVFVFTMIHRVQYNVGKDAEIVINNLKDVGIKVNLKAVDGWGALQSVRNSGEMQAYLGPCWGTRPDSSMTTNFGAVWADQGYWAPKWVKWIMSKGEEGEKPPEDVLEATRLRQLIVIQADLEDRKVTMRKIMDIAKRNLFSIGIVSQPAGTVIMNTRLQNVPIHKSADLCRPQLWFFEE